MYMEDFTKMLKEEMSLLDDKESDKGQELRKELGIEGLEGKELLKYKIDFLAKHMGHSDLHCMEKSDYFQELIKGCIDRKEAQEFFNLAKVTCIANDSSMTILCVLTDKEDGSKIIYSISDEGEITQVTQDDVKKQFESGMRTLSKSREKELKGVLFGTTEEQRSFKEQEIGKATINIDTSIKDEARDRKQRDEQEIGKATINVENEQKNLDKLQ